MTATNPTHRADQLAAATAHAQHTFDSYVRATPGAYRSEPTDQSPTWVRPFLEQHNQAVTDPDGHHACNHIADRTGPGVIHVAVWAPGKVCCKRCADAGLLNALVPPAETHRCDVCHHDRPNRLHHGVLRGGHALIHFAVCEPCVETGAVSR